MKAVRFQEPKGFEGIDGLVYEDAPDPQPAIGDALVQVRAAELHPDRAAVAALDRSRRTRPGAADPGARGIGRRGRARLRRRRRVGRRRGVRPHRRLPRRLGRRLRRHRGAQPGAEADDASTSSKPPRSRRPRSRRGRRCSTTAISSPARRCSSTAPAAGSDRWRCRSPAGPAPTSSEPVAPSARQRVLDLGAERVRRRRAGRLGERRRPGRPGLRHHRRRRARSFGGARQARWRDRLDHGSDRRPIAPTSARWVSFATRTVRSSARSPASSTTGSCAPRSAPSSRWRTRARRSWPSPPSTFRARSC